MDGGIKLCNFHGKAATVIIIVICPSIRYTIAKYSGLIRFVEVHMACTLKLPVGIDSFEKIRRNRFYYIDKTKLIEQLVETGGEVTLFTRPRRFGKTLNMSMLKAFFETDADESLFDGLYITQNKVLCEEHMGKYPVIFLSLKSVEGLKYEDARYRITELIGIEAERFGFLEDSEYLSENEKKRYKAIIALKDGTNAMDEKVLVSSLQILSQLLYKHFLQVSTILKSIPL